MYEDLKLCVDICVESDIIRKGNRSALTDSTNLIEFKKTTKVFFGLFNLDVSGIYKIENRNLIICFEGSRGILDWIFNFMFKAVVVVGDKKIHKGFVEQFEVIKDEVTEIIKKNRSKFDTIYFTGHSLGGALASVASHYCKKEITPNKRVIHVSFGSPKVGNKEFAERYDELVDISLRVQNGNDFLAKMPPDFFGYRHLGMVIRGKKFRFPWISPSDHYIVTYRSEVEKLK